MCSFTVLGGPKTIQYLVRPPFASPSATHLLWIELIRLLIVECWSTPLQWLCEVAGYWQELEHAAVYADPEHPKHAQWVTCPVSMLAMQELGCFQLPGIVYRSLQHGACIIMLQHEVMAQQWASGSRHGISVHLKFHQ